MPKSDIAIAFASVVKKHRKVKGMSQELLAEKADVHPIYIGYVERSVRNPTIKTAKAIATALGISLAEMIAEAEQIQRKQS